MNQPPSSTENTALPENGPVMNGRLLRHALPYALTGGLSFRNGHIPQGGHQIPEDFVGVGVTTNDDPATDEVVLEAIRVLKLKQVRLDFTYGDEDGAVARLLERLLNTEVKVLLSLVQPFREAQQMKQQAAQERWQDFINMIASRYGKRVAAVEIGATCNRRRWAGYDTQSFFNAWDIAWRCLSAQGIAIAGPNISDFEPLYNIAMLKEFRALGQLPDIHTNNLFSERVTEPERFDHRILGIQLATRLRFNLVKKARLLRKINDHFGVKKMVTPAAFWTLPRIERLLLNSEQKHADYLSRYFILLAASGAFDQVNWGPLICAREGLIDDGTGSYPALERITHYRSVSGQVTDFRVRPAFQAMQAFNRLIPGSVYLGPLQTAEQLEIHVFQRDQHLIHAAWTVNGQAVALSDLYSEADLATTGCFSRDGEALTQLPDLITEAPVYLRWTTTQPINIHHSPARVEHIYRHWPDKQYFVVNDADWRGMIVANSAEEAEQIRTQLHPDNLPAADEQSLLRKARNAIWKVTGIDGEQVVVKKPLKMHPHKRLLDRHKPSKAHRSWNAAGEMLRRNVPTAKPIAYFDKVGDESQLNNYFICERVDYDFTAREMLSAFAEGHTEFDGIRDKDAYQQLATFLLHLHGRGIWFRDLAGGNILVKKHADARLEFTLVDINRARFFNKGIAFKYCLSDLARICNKLHWPGRHQLLGMYFSQRFKPQKLTFRNLLPFYLYDFKVSFKRRFGRKAVRRIWRKLRGQQ